MYFTLKKILASLLLPLPICLLLLLIGLALVAWTRARKTGISLLTLGCLVLILFSTNPIASHLMINLEQRYQPLNTMPAHAKYIVVLGGGNGGSKQHPPNTQLSSASLARLVEGVRLYQQAPDSTLVLSGGRVFGSPADANVMNNTAVALGVRIKQMKIEAGSRDTIDEAEHLQPLLGKRAFVLVTSAYHMARAMAIFQQDGMHPIPAPTQFMSKRHQYNMKYYFPSALNLIHSDIALHEYMGLFWLRLKQSVNVTAQKTASTTSR